MNRFAFVVITTAIATMFSVFCGSSHADVLSATGGLAFGRNSGFNDIRVPAPTFGAEYTLRASSHLQFGGFFDHELIHFNDDTAGSLNFMGMVIRYHFVGSESSGPFVDIKGGLGSMSTNTMNPNQILSYGTGAGYQIVLTSVLSLSPRMGVSFLPDSPVSGDSREPRYEGGVMISFHF